MVAHSRHTRPFRPKPPENSKTFNHRGRREATERRGGTAAARTLNADRIGERKRPPFVRSERCRDNHLTSRACPAHLLIRPRSNAACDARVCKNVARGANKTAGRNRTLHTRCRGSKLRISPDNACHLFSSRGFRRVAMRCHLGC